MFFYGIKNTNSRFKIILNIKNSDEIICFFRIILSQKKMILDKILWYIDILKFFFLQNIINPI
jgi:hypothetical protein